MASVVRDMRVGNGTLCDERHRYKMLSHAIIVLFVRHVDVFVPCHVQRKQQKEHTICLPSTTTLQDTEDLYK